VQCRGLETLCLGNHDTDDASVNEITGTFPNLREVVLKCVDDEKMGLPSLLTLSNLPGLRHFHLKNMKDGLWLSKECIKTLAPALQCIETFSAEIRENKQEEYSRLFRRLCPSAHLTDVNLDVPFRVSHPTRRHAIMCDPHLPLMRNWLANEPREMQYPFEAYLFD
jgi:hypothetical protein